METIRIDAEKAFELMYELFKAKPWLTSAGVMKEDDHQHEGNALLFLISLDKADDWGDCREEAQRVANTLLVDFTARLRGPLYHQEWSVPADLPKPKQAACIVRHEILRSHPHLAELH
ncbi:MAG: hypothetical protein ACRBB4_01480 [Neptuniibacter sp.]